MDALERELRGFVLANVDGEITSWERPGTGSSRLTVLADVTRPDGSIAQVVVRHDSGDGPNSGTDIDLAHEAAVYRALTDQPVRIPRLVAEADDGMTLLIERVHGSETFGAIADDAQRAAVANDFARALAELHSIDARHLTLPGVRLPADASEHATLDLERWAGIARARVPSPSPIIEPAVAWLRTHAPRHVERTVLCHGDAGAGNFLFEGERVTALLDWEFAHVGDPLDDIAWIGIRSHLLGGSDEMHAALATWTRHSGLTLDADRVRYYRGLVLLRMTIACEVGLAHARDTGAMDATTYELLLPYLSSLLPHALIAAGCDDRAIAAIAKDADAALAEHPVLAGLTKPLAPFEVPS